MFKTIMESRIKNLLLIMHYLTKVIARNVRIQLFPVLYSKLTVVIFDFELPMNIDLYRKLSCRLISDYQRTILMIYWQFL